SETVRHGLGTVPHTELAEQPASVGLHRVLGQIQLSADLTVALALTHSTQYLKFPLGELDSGIGRLPRCRYGRAGECVRKCCDELRTGGVPPQVSPGSTGDSRGDATRVVRGAEHDHVRLGVRRDQAPGGLHTGRHSTLRTHEHDIDRLPGIPGKQLVTVRYAVDATDAGNSGHHAGKPFANTASVVADQDRRHRGSFLQPGDIPLPLSDALGLTLTRSGGFFWRNLRPDVGTATIPQKKG